MILETLGYSISIVKHSQKPKSKGFATMSLFDIQVAIPTHCSLGQAIKAIVTIFVFSQTFIPTECSLSSPPWPIDYGMQFVKESSKVFPYSPRESHK